MWGWKSLFLIGFTLILIFADSYLGFERKVSDFLVNLNSIPPKDEQVVIVGITEGDYKNLFNSRSPLSPARVTEIIAAISKGEPKVLGVDILTSDDIHKQYVPKESPFPIVWVEEAIKNEEKGIDDYKNPLANQGLLKMNYAALPEIPIESDGIHRLYQRTIEIERRGEKTHPTFAWKIYELAKPEEARSKTVDNEEYYIRFAGKKQQDERLVIPTSQILDEFRKENIEELKKFLKGKVVLLGGMYSDSRDKGTVPFGEMYGVEIHSTIIETELHGQPQKPLSSLARVFINLLIIFIFPINFTYLGLSKKSVSIAVFPVIILGVILSLTQYGNLSGFPVLILIFSYGLLVALFDWVTDKYKETFGSLFNWGRGLPN